MTNTFYFLDAGWNSEPNKFNPATGGHDAQPPSKYCTAPYWLIERNEGVNEYVDHLINWMYKKQIRLNRLILAAHGNAGQLFLGKGLEYSNAGFLKPLAEWFTGIAGGERTIRIYGCGVASSTPVDVKTYAKTQPPRQAYEYIDEYGRPIKLITAHPKYDILIVQGKFSESGQGMRFLKAIAECTGAAVQAPINMEINYPPYFKYELGTVWVYPNQSYIREPPAKQARAS